MSSESELEDYLEDLVSDFEEYYPEDVEEMDGIFKTYRGMDFRKPIQLEIFYIEDPIPAYALVKTHDDNRDDFEIIINGPFDGKNFIEEADSVLESPRWQQPVEKSRISHRRDVDGTGLVKRRRLLRDLFSVFVETVEDSIFQDYDKSAYTQLDLGRFGWGYVIIGDILELDPTDISIVQLEGLFDSVDEDRSTEEPDSSPPERDRDGLGTYFYKPIWVGSEPEQSFKDKILNEPNREKEAQLNLNIQEIDVYIRQDGFICVDESDPQKALNILNSIFSASLYTTEPFLAATVDDLVEVRIESQDDTTEIRPIGSPERIERKIIEPYYNVQNEDHFRSRDLVSRDIVETETLEAVVDLAESICADEDLQEKAKSLLQAYTHHKNGEFRQSYLLTWIAIEQHINQFLDSHLKNTVGVNHDRRKKVTSSANWTSTHKIEVLEMSNAISNTQYDSLNKMRKKRNNVVHDMETVSQNESSEIIGFAHSLMKEELSEEDILKSDLDIE